MNKTKKNNKNKIAILKELCGLPDNYSPTSHCFNDETHQTCCNLNFKSQEHSRITGNPLDNAIRGALNELNMQKRNNNKRKKLRKYVKKHSKEQGPWCTCTGSTVCGNYGDIGDIGADNNSRNKNNSKNNNNNNNNKKSRKNKKKKKKKKATKTNISFINVPNTDLIVINVDKDCEALVRDALYINPHLTPGVNPNKTYKCNESKKKKIKYLNLYTEELKSMF